MDVVCTVTDIPPQWRELEVRKHWVAKSDPPWTSEGLGGHGATLMVGLTVEAGEVAAKVIGSSLYRISVKISEVAGALTLKISAPSRRRICGFDKYSFALPSSRSWWAV
jgi:hypothetical protein